MIQTTNLDLFAGIPVGNYAALLEWYERLLGFPPACFPAVCSPCALHRGNDRRPAPCRSILTDAVRACWFPEGGISH